MIKLDPKFTRALGNAGLTIKKYSPEVMVIGGVVGVVVSAVLACKATTKLDSVVTESNEAIQKVVDAKQSVEEGKELVLDNGENYTVADANNDIKILTVKKAFNVCKLYAPSVGLGLVSVASILGGTHVFRQRSAAMAAAYASLSTGFKEYRDRVVDKFGKEIDKELRFNIKEKEFEETVIDKNGKEKTVKKKVPIADGEYSIYAKVYDEYCLGWQKDPESNMLFLKRQQDIANDRLKRQGHLFLNDVYAMLGIPKTKAGQCVGWVFNEDDPNCDNNIDFGLYNINRESCNNFINGYDPSILLDFNVDGDILYLF